MVDETMKHLARHLALAAAKLESNKPKQTDKLETVISSSSYNIRKPVIRESRIVAGNQLADFGKINPFIADSEITLIECSGPGKEIKVKKNGEVITTKETLTLEEITSIVQQFSQISMAPLTQMFKARIGNLSISAFVSPVAGTRFMIIKN